MSPKKKYQAAIYLRLSRDDEENLESNSIQNQRALLKSFVESHSDIVLKREFADDGFSGTNFERPGFQKMMEMVRARSIDCIIVKDLSRLGRNYTVSGTYKSGESYRKWNLFRPRTARPHSL